MEMTVDRMDIEEIEKGIAKAEKAIASVTPERLEKEPHLERIKKQVERALTTDRIKLEWFRKFEGRTWKECAAEMRATLGEDEFDRVMGYSI